MSSTTIPQRQAAAPSENPLLVIERILRDRDGVWRQIHREQGINQLILQMLASTAFANFCYGAVMGAGAKTNFLDTVIQSLAAAIKLPLLFLMTLAICLPTLYLFNLVFGSRLSVRQALAVVLSGITVISMLTLAFAPISLFFLITAPDYDFFKLLNVAILALTGLVGLGFLLDGMRSMNALAQADIVSEAKAQGLPAPTTVRPVNMSLIYLWIVLFGFVGTQLGWTLRPFFGDPGQGFEIFRFTGAKSNFYVDIFRTLIGMLG